jgi:hypothetical protein
LVWFDLVWFDLISFKDCHASELTALARKAKTLHSLMHSLARNSPIPRSFLSLLASQAKLAARRQRAEANSSAGSEQLPPAEKTSPPPPPAPAAAAAAAPSPAVGANQKANSSAGYGRVVEEEKRYSSEKDENRNSLIKFLEGDASTLDPKA